MDEKSLCQALEAILFASGDSMERARLSAVLGVSEEETDAAAQSLADMLKENARGIRLIRLEDSYQLVSAPEWSDVITRVMEKRRNPRLSSAALEALAIVAYYQPVTRAYIDKVRGVDSSYTVTYLAERGLIAPCGRLEAPGRPTLFGTTEQFLRTMGISALDELPPLPDMGSGEGIQALQDAIEAAGGEQLEIQISGN